MIYYVSCTLTDTYIKHIPNTEMSTKEVQRYLTVTTTECYKHHTSLDIPLILTSFKVIRRFLKTKEDPCPHDFKRAPNSHTALLIIT